MTALNGRNAGSIAVGALIVGAVFEKFNAAPTIQFEYAYLGEIVTDAFLLLLAVGGLAWLVSR